jgi:hypothetical protein
MGDHFKKQAEGTCHICGQFGPLTFEHSPPAAAYNDHPVVLAKLDEWESGYGSEYLREGRGAYVLCGRCNNDTGGAYGGAFVDWCRQGFERLHQTVGKGSLNYHGEVYPLRVIKQIVTIFFATTGERFAVQHPELVKFVLDKDATGLSAKYDFRVFWFGGGNLRQTGITGVLNTETGGINIVAEFVHPPFGYVMSLSGAMSDRRPEQIGEFANYRYDEKITLNRRLPVLETNWMMPGDYRTLDEISRDELINTLEAQGIQNARALLEKLDRAGGH